MAENTIPNCTLPPLSLYIHVPWCVRKCPYCDFNSHAVANIDEDAYLDALIRDLQHDRRYIEGRDIQTVFIGGGTPSLLNADFYQRLFDRIQPLASIASDAEITMEANPGTFEREKFKGFRHAGINRLSVGVQSFQPEHLLSLGRIHGADEAKAALAHLPDAGFDNFNIDLMHGLPEQTPEQALADLETALTFAPSHLSWYQLTIEPNTEFYSRPPDVPDDDTLSEIQDQGEALLATAGFEHYEVSAFARPGNASRHNLNYWTFGDYLGIGAGAHGKITLGNGDILRTSKTRQPDAYLRRIDHFIAQQQTIGTDDLPLEFMMNALRLKSGVTESLFTERTGLPIASLTPKLTEARRQALLVPDRLQATPTGWRYLNMLLDLFL